VHAKEVAEDASETRGEKAMEGDQREKGSSGSGAGRKRNRERKKTEEEGREREDAELQVSPAAETLDRPDVTKLPK